MLVQVNASCITIDISTHEMQCQMKGAPLSSTDGVGRVWETPSVPLFPFMLAPGNPLLPELVIHCCKASSREHPALASNLCLLCSSACSLQVLANVQC